MANHVKQEEVRAAVEHYLSQAREGLPAVFPISINALSKALGFHRNTVAKYVTQEELERARGHQARYAKSKTGRIRTEAEEKVAKRDAEIAALRRRCEALLAQIAKMEGNAQRLGIDPAELWKSLEAPPHDLPH